MATFAGPRFSTQGLIFAIDAGNLKSYPGSGVVVNNLAGLSTSGSLSGSVYQANNAGTFFFDGINDFIELSFYPAQTVSEISLLLYINPSTVVPTAHVYGEESATFRQFALTENLYLTRDTSTGTTGARDNDVAISNLTANTWFHVGVTYSVSGAFKRYYTNGQIVGSSTTSIDTITTDRGLKASFGFPVDFPSTGPFYAGQMAHVLIYNRALSTDEIFQIFNATRSRFGI